MSRKAYTKEEREALREQLHQIGVELYREKGIQNVKLPEVIHKAGISKPFFYTFYHSIQDLLLGTIGSQRVRILDILNQIQAEEELSWEEKVEKFIKVLLHHQEYGICVLSPDEEVWLSHRLSKEYFDYFLSSQVTFFHDILRTWGLSENDIAPEVFCNYLLTIVVVRNNARENLPFQLPDYLDETAELSIKLFVDYLASLYQKRRT